MLFTVNYVTCSTKGNTNIYQSVLCVSEFSPATLTISSLSLAQANVKLVWDDCSAIRQIICFKHVLM